MSAAESLREFVTERLAAAAEDILGVFNRTLVQYEEELERQRKQLDLVWKPHIHLHRIELPQQHDCKEEEKVFSDQQPCNQEWNSSLDQEDPELVQIKEEKEEYCTSQDREQLELQQQTEYLTLNLTGQESENAEPEVRKEEQLLSHTSHDAANQDPQKGKHEDSESPTKPEQTPPKKVQKRRSQRTKQPKVHYDPREGKMTIRCDKNGETFPSNSSLQTQLGFHTGKKMERQRKQLDLVWKPHIHLHRIELPQQHDCKEEEKVFSDQQPCNQERNSSPDQEDPEPVQMKEEEEEYCTSQDREQLELQQQTECLTLNVTCQESENAEPEVRKEEQLLSHNSHDAASQDSQKGRHEDSESTTKPEQNPPKKIKKRKSRKTKQPKVHSDPQQGEKTFRCDTNGETFPSNSSLQTQLGVLTGEKKQTFRYECLLTNHAKSNQEQSLYTCSTCGRTFRHKLLLTKHTVVHTGERPYSCSTCGKSFRWNSNLRAHMQVHLREKLLTCKTCSTHVDTKDHLRKHMKKHTAAKPHFCSICGKSFRWNSSLKLHMFVHTGEKLFTCKTCSKSFNRKGNLKRHIETHTGEKPYSCSTCGEKFARKTIFNRHTQIHTGEEPVVPVGNH